MSVKFLIEDDETHEVIGYCNQIHGMDGKTQTLDQNGNRCHKIILLDLEPSIFLDAVLRNKQKRPRCLILNIQVISLDECKLGSYNFVSKEWQSTEQKHGRFNIEMLGHLGNPMGQHSLNLWGLISDKAALKKNMWIDFSYDDRRSWLDIVRTHYCATFVRRKIHLESTIIEIEARNIIDYPSFFIAMGEAVCGAGGYLGSDLDGMSDRLSDLDSSFKLVWHHSDVSKTYLDEYCLIHERSKSVIDRIVALDYAMVDEHLNFFTSSCVHETTFERFTNFLLAEHIELDLQ